MILSLYLLLFILFSVAGSGRVSAVPIDDSPRRPDNAAAPQQRHVEEQEEKLVIRVGGDEKIAQR